MGGDSVGVSAAVAMIAAGFDALFAADLTTVSSTDLTALAAGLEVQRRRGESFDQTLVGQVVERGIAGEYARTSPVDLLVQLLRVSPREARARVGRARDMGPRRAVSGAALEPILAEVAAAQRAGVISGEHASVIAQAIDAIPDRFDGRFDHLVENALVDQARHLHPGEVAKAGQLLLARIDHDGVEPRDEEKQRRRDFGIRTRPDGTGTPYGTFTPALCAAWEPILDALAAPIPADDNGERDDRTAGQRRHDAILEAGLRLLRSGTLPDAGGTPVTILAHVDADELTSEVAGPAGVAVTAHGTALPIGELLRLASEGQLTTVVTSATGGVLSYGQTRRLASCGQRQALAARDRGCCFPGCTRPPAWCQAHHVIPWYLGGDTALDNLCLVCSFHHREFDKRGWTIRMRHGVPEWTPPAWLDPAQVPRRNSAHHLTDFTFELHDTG